jgi:plasmid replication initiation protein
MAKNKNIIQSYLITTAKYDFTADEKRVLSNLINVLQPLLEGKVLRGKVQQDLFQDYCLELPSSTFLGENDKTNHSRIKKALDLLEEKKLYQEDENSWRKIRLIESPRYLKRGVVQFRLAKELVEVFLNFDKGYSKYELETSLKLKSVYAMRLYELISGQTQPLTYKISYLKEIWGATQKAYERNYNFIQRVIIPAQEELNEKANWTFIFTPIKEGKKFTKIMFTPVHNPRNEDTSTEEHELIRQISISRLVENNLKNYLLQTCGFSVQEIKNNIPTLKKFSELYKQDTDGKIREIWARARDKRNPKSYLIGSIKCEIENI